MTEQRLLRLPQADANGLIDIVASDWEDTRTDVINIPDHEGIIRAIPAGVPVLEGARSVENLINPDLTAWAPVNCSVVLEDGWYKITASGGTGKLSSGVLASGLSQTYRFTAQANGDSFTFYVYKETSPWSAIKSTQIVSPSDNRYDAGLVTNSFDDGIVIQITQISDGDTVYVKDVLFEEVSGATDQNPSEVVEDFAYYVTEKDVSVDGSRIVTVSVGSLISPAPYWAHYPASTNEVEDSVITTVDWAVGNSAVITDNAAIGPDGSTVAAELDLTAHADSRAWINPVPLTPGATYTISMWIKAKTAGGQYPLTFLDGSGHIAWNPTITTEWARYTKTFTYTATDRTFYCGNKRDGTGTVENVYLWGAQMEKLAFASPIIETTGSTVNRSTCLMRYPYSTDVFNQAAGTAILIITLGYDSTDVPSNADGVLGLRNSSVYSFLYTANANGRINTYDGSNSKLVEPTWTAGDTITIGVHWTDGGDYGVSAKINADAWGTWDEGAYDGTFTAEDWISLFLGNDFNNQAHNVDIFDTDKGTDWVESYDPDTWVYTPPVTTGGGVGKRGKPKKKFAVIDGKMIQVASYQEAQELFKHLKKTKEVPKKRTIKLKASGTYVSVFDNPNTPMPLRTVREILNKKEEAEEEEMLLLFLM